MATQLEKICIICPSCSYLIATVSASATSDIKNGDGSICPNCKERVGWRIYKNRAFPYIKGKIMWAYTTITTKKS